MARKIVSIKTGMVGKNVDLLYSKKSKCISSPELNYFSHFAMRYPVLKGRSKVNQGQNSDIGEGVLKTAKEIPPSYMDGPIGDLT